MARGPLYAGVTYTASVAALGSEAGQAVVTGRPQPVAAQRAVDRGNGVEGQAGRRNGASRQSLGRLSSPNLIGREHELSLLIEAALSPPALVLVEGEAGVGKSRLVTEALAARSLRGTRVLSGSCHSLREPFPLGPVVEALRGADTLPSSLRLSPVAGALRPLLPELADGLPAEPGPIGDPRAERHQIFRALRELLRALGPTVCVLEDLHWADDGTIEFLAFLMAEPPESLCLVLTFRGEELPSSSPLSGLTSCLPRGTLESRLVLEPLTVDEASALIGALLDAESVSRELASQLHKLTAGIPFALEELVRLLVDQDRLDLYDGGRRAEPLDVPPSLRHSLAQRIESFSEDGRRAARAAAVISLPAAEDLIATVAGLPAGGAAAGITEALSAAVLEENGVGLYAFRHALAAQAVYDEIPGPERRRLHLRAAEALEKAPPPRAHAQLAHHFRAARHPRKWARHAEAAADAAIKTGDDRTAARLLEEALSAPSLTPAARVRMGVKLGSAALQSASPHTAIGPLQAILDGVRMQPVVRGELRYYVSRLRCQTGDTGPWREEMMRAAEELHGRPELASRAMVNLAWPVYGEEPVDEHLRWLRLAADAAAETDDAAARTAVYTQRAAILLTVGDPASWAAIEDIPPEGDLFEEKLQALRGYHSISVAALGLGHLRCAEEFLGEVRRLDAELEHTSWGPWYESSRISLDWRLGRWRGLEERVLGLEDRVRARLGLAVSNQLVLASLLFAQNRLEEAEGHFMRVLKLAEARQWMSSRVTSRAGLARLRMARGEAEEAWGILAPGLEVVRGKAMWVWGREILPVAVGICLACDRPSEAGELADELARGLKGREAPAAQAASAACQGKVAAASGEHELAAKHFERAERICEAMPSPYDATRARAARARSLLATGDSRGAELLLDAMKGFQALGATRDLGRTRAALNAAEIPLPSGSRGGRRPYGDELSPREAEVAELAAGGRKNREIAEMLFISQRTVETHVASALRKLGVDSREDLPRALEERATARAL